LRLGAGGIIGDKGIYQQLIANGCGGPIYRPDSFINRKQKAHLQLPGYGFTST
jgi:hypothetical protein